MSQESAPAKESRMFSEARAIEQRAKEIHANDPEEGRREYSRASAWLEERCAFAEREAGIAAIWLRCLRRADEDQAQKARWLESLTALHPTDPRVKSAALFLQAELLRVSLLRTETDSAIDRLQILLGELQNADRSAPYLAMSVLGALGAFAQRLREGNPIQDPDLNRLVDAVVRVLEPQAPFWISRLPEPSGTDDDSEISPKLRAWFLLRRLGEHSESFQILYKWMRSARETGLCNEWLVSSEIKSLLALGCTAEALAIARELESRFAQSEHFSRLFCEALSRGGQEDAAFAQLQQLAILSRGPWAWRDLAQVAMQRGDRDLQALALEAGLHLRDKRQPGMVWRLHFDRARLHIEDGNEQLGAEELALSTLARETAGWGEGKLLQGIRAGSTPSLQAAWRSAQQADPKKLLETAGLRYRRSYEESLNRFRKLATVRRYSERLAFVQFEGEREQDILLPIDCKTYRDLKVGCKIRAVRVRSFDRKRDRWGHRAVQATQAP